MEPTPPSPFKNESEKKKTDHSIKIRLLESENVEVMCIHVQVAHDELRYNEIEEASGIAVMQDKAILIQHESVMKHCNATNALTTGIDHCETVIESNTTICHCSSKTRA